MCHLSRLKLAQRVALAAMAEPYRRIVEQEVEQLPSDGPTVREFFARWTARLEGVDNARRVREITEDTITEELADILPAPVVRARKDALAERREWERFRRTGSTALLPAR